MEKKFRLFLLLALLLTAATGAWAQSAFTAKEITSASQLTSTDDEAYVAACMPSDFLAVDAVVATAWTGAPTDGSAMLIYAIDGDKIKIATFLGGSNKATTGATWSIATFKTQMANSKFYYTAAAGYTVSLKDGVKDADKWTVKVGDGQAQALPIGGLKGDGSETVTLQYNGRLKVKGVKATSEAAEASYTLLSAATTADCGKVVCAAGHLHDAKTAVPTGCTAVGILGKVTETGHGLILALKDATSQTWNTIDGWTSVTTYAGTTLKVLPDDAARGTNLTSYTALGETAVSNWAVAGDPDYQAIFKNLGGAINDWEMYVLDNNVNAYITTGVGGSALDGEYWTAWTTIEELNEDDAVMFSINNWTGDSRDYSKKIRPVLGFGGEAVVAAKEPATVTTAPTGAAVVGVGKTTALVSGGAAEGGTMMYKVTTENTKPASTDGFSDAVPTAQSITASGKVYVWYYVKGDDTHSDSEIAATAIEVPVADIVWDATNVSTLSIQGTNWPYEKEGVALSCNANQVEAVWADYGDPATAGIFFGVGESGGFTFTAPSGKAFKKIVMKAHSSAGWNDVNLGDGWTFVGDDTNNIYTVTWKDSAASSVELLPDTDDFSGAAPVKCIGFYLSE